MTRPGHPGPRLLICGGPALDAGGVGGIQHVLADLAGGLRECGWHVETLLERSGEAAAEPWLAGAPAAWQFRLAEAGRALHVPEAWRLHAGVVLRGRTRLRKLSEILSGTQRTIESGGYAAVLACLDVRSPVGLGALVARIHPRSVLVSLSEIAFEVRHSRSIRSARAAARLVAGRDVHPDLYSPLDPTSRLPAVFASGSWRDDALEAGWPASQAKVIHFGVASPKSLPPPLAPGVPARLLWAARLSPQKGLHLFLPALALLRREVPLRLTILAVPERGPYPARIGRLIDRLGIADIVDYRPAVSRGELPAILGSQDVLLFHSVFHEPVAQMLLLAFAHGLVVVGPAADDSRSPLRDGDTSFCFTSRSAHEIGATIRRAIADGETRRRVRERAFELVRTSHDVADTIAAYDTLLREVADLPRTGSHR